MDGRALGDLWAFSSDTRRRVGRRSRSVAAAAVSLSILITATAAVADVVNPDADIVSVGNQASRDLGTVAPGTTITAIPVSFELACSGNRHVDLNQTATLSYDSGASSAPTGGAINSASTATIGTVPASWPDDASGSPNCGTPAPSPLADNGNSVVSLTAPTAVGGPYSYTVKYKVGLSPTGTNDSSSVTGAPTVTFTLSVALTNTAPTTPGDPFLSSGSSPNRTGVFTMMWTGSTDPQGDTITYTLQHRDADDGAFSDVATGLATNSYSFTAGSPEAEGTWTYRVKASDGSLSSGFSGSSLPVVVDTSAPNPPNASADRAVDYAGDGGWFKDAVTVTFSGDGDPALVDGSVGSGVAGVSAPVTFSTSGSHTASGTATDYAGNVSASTDLTVQVDATTPEMSIACPAAPVLLGATASAAWTASDAHSGLATAASGTVALETGSVGLKTASAPTATDHVGHDSDPAACQYSVVYDFSGFFQPVDNNLPNSTKAGASVPVKWRLTDANGVGISDPSSFVSLVSNTSSGACSGSPDALEEYAGSSGLQYLGDGYWQFNWKTPKSYAGQCRTMKLNLLDGQSKIASFVFR